MRFGEQRCGKTYKKKKDQVFTHIARAIYKIKLIGN